MQKERYEILSISIVLSLHFGFSDIASPSWGRFIYSELCSGLLSLRLETSWLDFSYWCSSAWYSWKLIFLKGWILLFLNCKFVCYVETCTQNKIFYLVCTRKFCELLMKAIKVYTKHKNNIFIDNIKCKTK